MSWKKAEREDLPALVRLVSDREWRSVPFSARLRHPRGGGRPLLPPRWEANLLVHREGEDADAALLLTSGGLLLPLLAPARSARRPAFPGWRGLARSLHSLMGPLPEVRWAEQALPARPRVSIEYHLMALEKSAYRPTAEPDAPGIPGLRLRPAVAADAPALYPLQRDYELEEVLIEPGHFSAQACLGGLRRMLRQQVIILAERDGRPVAKAGTNARGFAVDQIGGVFTVEAERGRGVARRVMRELLDRIFREKGTASLFVKKHNAPAIALYRRLGFRVLEDYRISYFRD